MELDASGNGLQLGARLLAAALAGVAADETSAPSHAGHGAAAAAAAATAGGLFCDEDDADPEAMLAASREAAVKYEKHLRALPPQKHSGGTTELLTSSSPGTSPGRNSMACGTCGAQPQPVSTLLRNDTLALMLCVQKSSGSMRMP